MSEANPQWVYWFALFKANGWHELTLFVSGDQKLYINSQGEIVG